VAKSDVVLNFGGRSGDEVVDLFAQAEKHALPTVGDLLYAGQRQRSRILSRTSKGTDVNETPFQAYSTKSPVYYYPGAQSNNKSSSGSKTKEQQSVKGRERATDRISKLIGLNGKNSRSVSVKGSHAQYVQKTTKGLKFSSYAAFKAAFGRLTVDLRGIQAPHMLQALIVTVQDFVAGQFEPAPMSQTEPANEVRIGIYGEEAQRASGHQRGAGHLPKRAFLGANDQDKEIMCNDIMQRMAFRIRQSLGISATVRQSKDTL
jgi:hypothetical protein